MNCYNDWFWTHGEQAINHFGRVTEPKKVLADSAWYKDYKYKYNSNGRSTYDHVFVNDLLGERKPITEQQYDDQTYSHDSLIYDKLAKEIRE